MNKTNQIVLPNHHRVVLIIMLISQYLLYAFSQVLFFNFHSMPLSFINYQSLAEAVPKSQTHYLQNALLYCLFWVQHIVMATLKYKISWFKKTEYFVLYDRYVYNISSGLILWFIFAQAQTSYEILFTIPNSVSVPLNLIGLMMFVKSMIQLGGMIFNPYKIRDLISSKEIKYQDYTSVKDYKLKTDGIYKYSRNPMQTGLLLILIFGNGIYTIDRLIFVGVMCTGVICGVMMQEKRMMSQYSDYKNYAKQVRSRFIPFLF